MVEKKMTKSDFVNNTNMALQDDEQLSEDYLKVSSFNSFLPMQFFRSSKEVQCSPVLV